jgi:hypothetical protein
MAAEPPLFSSHGITRRQLCINEHAALHMTQGKKEKEKKGCLVARPLPLQPKRR